VRVMTRVIETKAETSITKRLLRTMEMRTFRGAPLATRGIEFATKTSATVARFKMG